MENGVKQAEKSIEAPSEDGLNQPILSEADRARIEMEKRLDQEVRAVQKENKFDISNKPKKEDTLRPKIS